MAKGKSIAIVTVFLALLFGFAAAQLLPDAVVSVAERRKLAQKPEITVEDVLSTEYMQDLETYLLDQFPLRDQMRTVKALLRFGLFQQKDNNDVYLVDDSVFKIEYPLKEDQVLYAADKITQVYETWLQGKDVYYAVVPDKNYFVAEENGYPCLDYEKMFKLLRENLPNELTEITLTDVLTIEDYYRTDTHWRQERLFGVAQKLAVSMGLADALTPEADYVAQTLAPFYGVYCGQSALPVQPDTLSYLESVYTQAAVVTGIELDGETTVYRPDLFGGMDGYDVFLSGAQALLTVDVPNAKTDRELLLFRDSYGSSLAPLLMGAYSRITLIDLRYIPASMLGQFVDFSADNQDVLFLYSTSLLNSGMLLR